MEWLNYHHLLYFWTVARAGSIARASEELRLAQPTISNQLKTLEASLGVKLLERQGAGSSSPTWGGPCSGMPTTSSAPAASCSAR